MLEGIYRRSR